MTVEHTSATVTRDATRKGLDIVISPCKYLAIIVGVRILRMDGIRVILGRYFGGSHGSLFWFSVCSTFIH
jgi:hypothetical protein